MSEPGQTLTEIAMGYFRSRALCAAARLGVADALRDQERTVEDLALACSAHPESLYRLLRALASFGVVTETQPRSFVLAPLGQRLRKDHPESEWSPVVFWSDLLADQWAYLTECIRRGEKSMQARPPDVPARWSQDPDATSIFHGVFSSFPAENCLPIARAWDFSRYRVVADLGGAGGGLIKAVLSTYPNVRGMLVDRREAIDMAAPHFTPELRERCQLSVGEFRERVPEGADVHMLKHVLHGYTDEVAVEILKNCRAALREGGRVLIVEFVLPDVVDRPDETLERRLMSDLNMLAVTGGKERSAVEWKTLLAEAGFECLGIIPVAGDLASMIEARPLEHG